MNQMVNTSVTRRQFVVSSASAAGGLVISVAFAGLAGAASIGAQARGADIAPNEINAFLAINPDGSILIRSPHNEMGQGAITALPMIVAEELECDWSKVKVEYASSARNLRDHNVYGDMVTAGSRGVRTTWQMLLQAGASARVRLVASAAQRWNVPAAECEAANSKVTHKASGRSLDYGALAADAAKIKLDNEPAIRTPDQFKLIGKRLPRLDTPLKINGSAKFAIDTQIPGMIYAAIAACPVFGGKLKSVDDSPVEGRRGVQQVVKLDDAVAVVADRYWRAKEALALLKPEWDTGEAGKTDSVQFAKLYRDTLDGPMVSARNDGNVDEVFAKGSKIVEAVYEAPHLAHATMEPLNATVHLQGDKLDVWLGTQAPMGTIRQAVAASGLKPEQIVIHNCFLGGGFGRRTANDEMRQAILVAKQVGKPVKLVGTREEDMTQDRYRPQAVVRLKAALGADGMPTAFDAKIAVGSIMRSVGMNKVENGIEPQAIEGIANTNYKIPNVRVGCMLKNTHVPVMFWRSVGSSQNAFFMESYRRAGAGGRAGPLQVPPCPAGTPARLCRRARQDRRERRLGQTAARRPRPRHRHSRKLRLDSRPGCRGDGQPERRGAGRPRGRRGRLRPCGQSRHRRSADRGRGDLRSLRRALWRDHHQRWPRRAGQFPRLSGRAPSRHAQDRGLSRALRRQEMGWHRRARHAAHRACGRQCGVRGHRTARALAAAEER
jgi:isoquinoline 1-oxidoreductase beta subunit